MPLFNTLSLAGKTAVVTGSTSGIGLGIATALARADATLKLLGEKQPSASFATVEQIGGVAAFLCSEAANEMRGAELKVDGGWLAQ